MKPIKGSDLLYLYYIILFIVVFAVIHVSVSHLILFIEMRLITMREGKSFPVLKLLSSYFLEIYYKLVMPFFSLSALFCATRLGKGDQAIVLVHGYHHNSGAWWWFSKELDKAGMGPIYTVNLLPPAASIERLAYQLSQKIEGIKKETGSNKITLIGHSMGGLVSAYYAENLAGDTEVQ